MKKYPIILTMITGLVIVSILIASGKILPQKKGDKNQAEKTEIIITNSNGLGADLSIEFTKGNAYNHPLMAIWVEDLSGKYIQSLFVAKSIATGIFNFGDASEGQWTKGEIRRPAALPYWSHKRGIQAADGLYLPTPENPVPDAYSGATPKENFVLDTKLDEKKSEVFNVLLEINQPWDWNEYWTNAKYPDDYEYKTSCQPAVVYSTTIDLKSKQTEYIMLAIGHSHYSGKDGKLYEDLSTLTTALEIAENIVVRID